MAKKQKETVAEEATKDNVTKVKKQLMAYEFELNKQMKQQDIAIARQTDQMKEDRKDQRTKMQASQQSELIEQRKSGTPPKNFESSGNDIIGGGMGLGKFDPR